jgi:hypothetical protein
MFENIGLRRIKRLFRLSTIFYMAGLYQCSLFAQQQAEDSLRKPWSFSTTGYYYFVPDDENTFTLIGYADYRNLHFEARFNYEDENTGSVFGGYRFEIGNKIQFGITPMAGVVFGNTNGIAPGLELDITYKKFDYYSETEYVIDFSGKENNFLFIWGELAFSPLPALRTGIAWQKTHLYQTEFTVQRGLFAEYTFRKFGLGVFCFNPFTSDIIFSTSLTVDF